MATLLRILHIIDLVNRYTYNGVSLLFTPLTLIAVFEVAMRYLFNRPTLWAWDINLQLFCAIVVLGAGNTLFQGGHVIMDIIINRFLKRTRLFINLAVYLVFFFAMAFILQQVGIFAWRSILLSEKASTLLAPPVYPLKVGIFIGVVLLSLQAISLFLKNLISLISHSTDISTG